MEQPVYSVAVIGGGITGLAAAWHLQTTASTLSYILCEQSDQWGGKVVTTTLTTEIGAVTVDGGPETFVTRKPEVWQLIHELALEAEIVPLKNEAGKTRILHNGRAFALPLNPIAFITSGILSPWGKLRLLLEPLVPARRDEADESLADFARRRLGKPALRRIVGPVLGGIFHTDPQQQSILVSSPIMREMERQHGSLFRAMLARMRAARRNPEPDKKPRFISLAGGVGTIVEAVVSRLMGTLRLNTSIVEINQRDDGKYRLITRTGEDIIADAIVLALPANGAASLLGSLVPSAAIGLAAIQHSSIGTLTLAYRASDLPAELEMYGLMIPQQEGRAIDAVTWTSTRLVDRAPEGVVSLRAFFGRGRPTIVDVDDEELVTMVQAELHDLYGINATPLSHQSFRWRNSYPQATVGHLERLAAIEAQLPANMVLAGSSYRGVGVPDCIRQGRDAAQRLIDRAMQQQLTGDEQLLSEN